MIKGALFDLDGVVFDTEPQYTVFWGKQCRTYHPELPGLEQQIKGKTLVQIFNEHFAGMDEAQRAMTLALNEFERQMDYVYVPGLESFVKALRRRGVKVAVVTSSNREKMEAVYARRPEFKSLFDAVLTSEDFERSKPDPDGYLKGAARLGLTPDVCMGLEDSFNGLKAVRGAQMFTVALSTTNPAEAIRPLSDVVIPNYLDIDVDALLAH